MDMLSFERKEIIISNYKELETILKNEGVNGRVLILSNRDKVENIDERIKDRILNGYGNQWFSKKRIKKQDSRNIFIDEYNKDKLDLNYSIFPGNLFLGKEINTTINLEYATILGDLTIGGNSVFNLKKCEIEGNIYVTENASPVFPDFPVRLINKIKAHEPVKYSDRDEPFNETSISLGINMSLNRRNNHLLT